VIRLAAAIAAVALLGAGTPPVERLGATRAAIVLPAGQPAGSVILLPGGTTRTRIGPDGTTDSGNFVIRIRQSFVDAGFAIVYVADPSDLAPVVARMRSIARPVFYVGTSNGTTVAARSAAALGAAGPDGIVLTSTVTGTSGQYPYNAAQADLSRIAVPVLFVHNRNDDCPVSPAGGLAGLMARLPPATSVTRIDFSSDRTPQDPCGPFSPHGYLGIEDQVAAAIVAWMRAHGAQGTP
jgi:pimeloyl-ACP methyl ester carboxylesterase